MQRLFAVFLGLVFFALLASSLAAQERVEIFVGGSYSFPAVSVVEQPVYCPVEGMCNTPSTTLTSRNAIRGWELSGTRHFTSSLGLTVDASGNYGQATSGFPTNARAREYLILGGPQYRMPHKHFSAYVHALFGTVHQSVNQSGNSFFVTFPSSQWAFAGALGGGIDYKVSTDFSFRIVQADYLLTRIGSNFQSAPRLSAGLLIRF